MNMQNRQPPLNTQTMLNDLGHLGDYYDTNNLILFVQNSQYSMLREHKDFFISHKDSPHFQGLLFYVDSQKMKLLLDCGYNASIQLKDTPYEKYLTQHCGNTTLLHKTVETNSLKLLISLGAKHNVKAHMHPVEREFLNATGTKKIKTFGDIRQYLKFLHRHPTADKSKTYQNIINTLEQLIKNEKKLNIAAEHLMASEMIKKNEMINTINSWLVICDKDETPLERAERLKQKSKYLFLKNLADNGDIQAFEEREWENIKLQANPIISLSHAMKKDNRYLFDRLTAKHLIPTNSGGRNLAFYAVLHNCTEWLQKILEEGFYNVNQLTNNKDKNLLFFSYSQNKPNMFEIIHNQKKIDKNLILEVVSDLKDKMRILKKNKYSDERIMKMLPTSIIYFLVNHGHYFDNKMLLEKIVNYEKGKLNETIAMQETGKKSFKI